MARGRGRHRGSRSRPGVQPPPPGGREVAREERVPQLLLSEGVPIRDLGTIVEAIGDKARITRDTNLLPEYARQALGRARIRRHLRRLIAQAQPHLPVCSYNEIAPGINVETIGIIHA